MIITVVGLLLLLVACNTAVCDADFPSTSFIRRHVDQFQTHFSRDVVTLFTDLNETVQLNSLSIAIKTDHTQTRVSAICDGCLCGYQVKDAGVCPS